MTVSRQPAVSIVMPCHNAAPYLAETLASIRSQSYSDWEVIVVDDGSVDDPETIVSSFGDERFRLLAIPASGGPSRPRNLGISEARGQLIFFFDADDIMLPGKLEAQVSCFERNPTLALLFSNFCIVDAAGAEISPGFLDDYQAFQKVRHSRSPKSGGLDRRRFYLALVRGNFIGTSSAAVRRDVLQTAGIFDEGLSSAEDHDLWLRIARNFDCGYVDMVGHAYRRHSTSVTQQFDERHPRSRIKVISRNLPNVDDKATRRYLKRRLAENHTAVGYVQQVNGDLSEARRSYLRSLLLAPGAGALGGAIKCICWSLMGRGGQQAAGGPKRRGA